MKKNLFYLLVYAVCINIILVVTYYLYKHFNNQPYIAIFVTICMIASHSNIRIIIGLIVPLFVSRHNIDAKIHRVSNLEYKFLTKLGVKRYKDKYFAYDRSQFVIANINKESIEVALRNNINAELVHILCFLFSTLSILFGYLLSKDELIIYIITFIIAAVFIDIIPITIQRYNRYRLLKINSRFEKMA